MMLTMHDEIPDTLPRGWDTAAAALAACAQALGDPRDVATLCAASGLAFRLTLDAQLTPAGPHNYSWREVLTVAAERLGYRWQLVASRAGEPGFRAACDDAFALAQAGIAAGRPTLWFGVQLGEFGIVRGVDAAAGTLLVSGVLDAAGGATELLRTRIAADTGLLFVLQLLERRPVAPEAEAQAAWRAAVEAYFVRSVYALPGTAPAESGEGAWALWQRALEAGLLDPLGLAGAAQRYAEARSHAAEYLQRRQGAAVVQEKVGAAAAAYRRVGAMLGELARLVPYPPGPSFMLTETLRDEAAALVAEAARAEAAGASALGEALSTLEQRAATADLAVRPLDATTLPDLFACVNEIPLAGLQQDAALCRRRLAPLVETGGLAGRLLYAGSELVGHVLWAPLETAQVPIAAEGRRWFLYCPWVAQPRRYQGAGHLLFAALDEAARAAGIDGILTLTTSIDVFLHHAGYERAGFVELERQGDTRLLELRMTERPSQGRLRAPEFVARRGRLPVVVRHSYTCPLLLHVRRDAAELGRQLGPKVRVDEADAAAEEGAGVTVGGRALPHGPVAGETLREGLSEALHQWGGG